MSFATFFRDRIFEEEIPKICFSSLPPSILTVKTVRSEISVAGLENLKVAKLKLASLYLKEFLLTIERSIVQCLQKQQNDL